MIYLRRETPPVGIEDCKIGGGGGRRLIDNMEGSVDR